MSIYIYLRDNPKATELPDARPRKPNELSWSLGALDGVFGHHTASPKPEEMRRRIQKLLNSLKRLVRAATDSNLKSLYEAVVEESILPIADSLQSELSQILSADKSKLAQVGRYFAAEADRREATKFGLLLLELTGSRTDVPLLETLALNDEFTLFAALALAHVTDDPETALFSIAKRVHGWGRIQVVERLSTTRNQEIQEWMLREGFRNEVMDGYLAGICARTGNLHLALDRSEIDRPLLDGAAGIIRALVEGGPASSIDDYEHAPIAIQRYVSHVFGVNDLDLEHLHFSKVRSAPLTSGSWYRLLQQTDETQIDEVIAFAMSVLPLEKIATGPDNHLGIGPGYEAHHALDWLLQDLKRFPGKGWELIRAGLRSPVVRNRNMALQAFLAWPRDQWPAEALGLLREATRAEPDKDVRGRIEKAIRSN